MEDIIQKYKKQRRIQNIAIVVTSLVLAFWINFLVSNTQSGQYLKSSVLGSQINSLEHADLFLQQNQKSGNQIISLVSWKHISQVKSISLSLLYNWENISIKSKEISIDGWEVIDVIQNDGFNTIIINFAQATDISSGKEIIGLVVSKNDESLKENINMINANITDEDENNFSLSTSGIEF